jgi:LmbE family N-acetylglucosaminyl deacetylase
VEHGAEAPAVILSPHLDDAVLSAWSVLRGPGDVTVVNVFAGVPATSDPPRCDRLVRASDSRALVLERRAEDREALARAERTPLNLDFLDGQYRDADPGPRELSAAVAEVVPAAATLHAPAAIRGHRDHELVRDLAIELGRSAGIPVVLYADLPYAVHYGWPAWVTGDERQDHLDPEVDWELALASAAVARDALEPRVVRLGANEAAAKLGALRCYSSQFELLNRGPLGLLDHPRVLPFEVRWTVGARTRP